MKDKIIINCKDFELTEAIESYATEKVVMLDRLLNQDDSSRNSHLRLGKTSNSHQSGKIFYAELSIHTAEKNFGSRVEAENIYEAIDLLKDDLFGNITHYKDKIRTIQRKEESKFKKETLHKDE